MNTDDLPKRGDGESIPRRFLPVLPGTALTKGTNHPCSSVFIRVHLWFHD
jgi:hypothetical protein